MTKDRLHYRLSRKHAHGADEVERSIGITCTRCARVHAVEAVRRPTALLKWAFDDYVVEEELPAEAFPTAQATQPTSYVVRLLSEGVPDTVVERQLRERLPHGTAFHFLTPVDHVSCAARYVWLRCRNTAPGTGRSLSLLGDAFATEQRWHTNLGDIYAGAAQEVLADPEEPRFPAHLLPRTRYTITLRNIQGSLGDVLPQLRGVAKDGFLNYSHAARHGVGLFRVYEDAKLLLRREYGDFLRHYVGRLSEGTTAVQREMPVLQEVLAAPQSSRRDWAGVVTGVESAVKHDAQVCARSRQTGVYLPHHGLLLDFVRRAADIAPRHHDSAQLIRAAVRPLVVQETLHAIAEVHFNALASLRWQREGDTVAVGDVVQLPSRTSTAAPAVLDVFAGAADHINGAMVSAAHQDWSAMAAEGATPAPGLADGRFKRVASTTEAAQYTVHDVVVPTYGQGAALLPCHTDSGGGAQLHAALAQELRVTGLPEMRLAPRATLRPLVQRPTDMSFYLVDENRGWDWEEDAGAAALKSSLYHDHDGVLRYRSPLARRTGKNLVARLGIREEAARAFFLKPARKAGMTCVLQFTLPPGSHATSLVREAFAMATLSPSAIFRLIAGR